MTIVELRCTYPLDPSLPLCNRPARVRYSKDDIFYDRCTRHDTDKVRITAEAMGFTRRELP